MERRVLVLLRHGRSRADDENVHEGRYDSPLTDVGRNQATQLSAHWAASGRSFDWVVASSLVRARETAEIVVNGLGLPVEISDLWMERDNGPLAGLSPQEAAAKFPEPAFRSRWAPLTALGGESRQALHARASGALEDALVRDHQRILVVAHGGILDAALRILLGTSDNAYFPFGDTGFAELGLDDFDRVQLISFGPNPSLA